MIPVYLGMAAILLTINGTTPVKGLEGIQQYMSAAETDIGSQEYLDSVLSTEETETIETTETETTETETTETETIEKETIKTMELETTETTETETTQTAPTIIVQDNEEVVALLSEQVELLAENSSTATGTINTTILDLMDRMVDSYPDYYEYAGFRTSTDDAYQTTLYIAKKANVNGSNITFSEDCKAVHFYRQSTSSYNNYVYYEVTDSPNASVDINNRTIVYTNVLDNYPTLGNKTPFPSEMLWIGLLLIGVLILFTRKNS